VIVVKKSSWGKLDLTIDIAIYSLFYIGFLMVIFPLLTYLIGHFAAYPPKISLFFVEVAWFCQSSLYIPVIIPVVIVGWCELYTHIFDSLWTRIIVKCVAAFFLIFAITAIALPMTISLN